MTFIPNRTPIFWRSNVTANTLNGVKDQRDRDWEFVRDEDHWVAEFFDACPPNAVPVIQCPDGRDPSKDKYDPSLFPHGSPARDKFLACCDARRLLGLPTALYVGRKHPNGSPMSMSNPLTRKWFREDLAPYREAAGPHLWLGIDTGADDKTVAVDMYRAGDAFGVHVINEAIATLPASGPVQAVDPVYTKACPWLCDTGFIKSRDPLETWRLDPPHTECHCRIDDAGMSIPDTLALIDGVERRGLIPGAAYGSRAEVLGAVFGGKA